MTILKILIIQGSPDDQSLSHANADNFYQRAQELDFQVDMVDLSKDDFDPVLRFGYRQHMPDERYPDAVQEKISWADCLVFFFPVWWAAEPAVLKGWLDRVLTPGFAYQYKNFKVNRFLTGKSAYLFVSCHAPAFYYRLPGSLIWRWKRQILGYVGIKVLGVKILGAMASRFDTAARRQKFLDDSLDILEKMR